MFNSKFTKTFFSKQYKLKIRLDKSFHKTLKKHFFFPVRDKSGSNIGAAGIELMCS